MTVNNWSFSSLKQYENCPKQYHEVRVLQKFKPADTEQTIYGKAIHRVIQKYIEDGTPFPKLYAKVLSKIPKLMEVIPHPRYCEHEMGITVDGHACGFRHMDAWMRGITDLLAIENKQAIVIDWKTGNKNYADTRQLDLMALLTFTHFPQIERVRSMLYFIKDNHPVFGTNWERDQIPAIWAVFKPSLLKLASSFDNQNWPMIPSGLCGWCPVEDCTHWRPSRRR